MYNELASKRQKRLQESYHYLQEALEQIDNAIADEIEEAELTSLERIAGLIQDILDECVTYVNVPSEEDLVDEFLYGR